jgi:DNA-binding transcriptional regulator YhcF (GntR family)
MPNRKTSIKLIETAVSEKWIRQLAFYHLMKFHFNNSCIYNYRSRMKELADNFHISEKTLYNYLKVLRSKELIYDHANNLKLISIRQLKSWKKTLIDIDLNHDLWDVTCLLYAKLIEKRIKQQAFRESVRRFGRGDRYKDRLSEIPFQPSISYRSIAKLLDISKNQAVKVVKNLNRLGIIKTIKQKPQLIARYFTDLKSIEDFPGYHFTLEGCLFEIFGNQIELIKYPIYLKNITLKQYLENIE